MTSQTLKCIEFRDQAVEKESMENVESDSPNGVTDFNVEFHTQGSHVVRQGDVVECELTGWAPLDANPEDIPLEIVYEDKHVIVINKPAHMVCASVEGKHLPLLS